MKLIYTSPNKECEVHEQSDPEWQEVFGIDSKWYNISDGKDVIYGSIPTLESAFHWLKNHNFISNDEMLYQISLIK